METLGKFLIGPNNLKMQTPWGGWSAFFMSIGFFVFQIIMIMAVGLALVFSMVGGQVFVGGMTPDKLKLLLDPAILAVVISYVLTMGLIFFVAGRRGGVISEVLLFNRPIGAMANAVFGIVALAAFFALLSFVVETFFTQDARQNEEQLKEIFTGIKSSPFVWLGIGVVVIGAPVLEETVFRGFLLGSLAKTRLGFWGGAVVSSALWALIHGYAASLAIGLFIFGMLLSLMVRRTGSVWHSIGLHAIWNGVVTAATFATLGG